jgi:SAM-dependent methyltransferase
MSQDLEIIEVVQARYGAIALGTQANCCGPECGCADGNDGEISLLYEPETFASLPEDVTSISLGCGNPVAIAQLLPGQTVLDLGSGGGIDCFLAARQVGETGHVIGVDMTTPMLERANANRDKLGMTNVEFRKGRIEALPVADQSVDVIISNCVINLAPDKSAVFAEAMRVLKPGGRVMVSDIVTEGDFSDELRADTARWAECVTGAIDVNAYTGLLKQAGFGEIEVRDLRNAGDIVEVQEGMPLVYSAYIAATKPS